MKVEIIILQKNHHEDEAKWKQEKIKQYKSQNLSLTVVETGENKIMLEEKNEALVEKLNKAKEKVNEIKKKNYQSTV